MKYISTRGNSPAISFTDVLTTGLAPDGGLYMPESIPSFSRKEISSWRGISYQELVQIIITPYIGGTIPSADLRSIIEDSYSEFRHVDIAPIVPIRDNEYLLELFHGPTLAFKDFALQLLGRLLDYVLKKKNQHVVVVGATSGDTGSAAIEGCRHSSHISIFMLHPHGRVSDVQRRQMTTILADNVHNLAVKGNFDDCQNIVKALFGDKKFNESKRLVAVNSINWARIMAQIVYYFYAFLKLDCPQAIAFSVPTGNFGDVFAGYIALKMGLPIEQLVVATNENDILHRFFQDNDYSKSPVKATVSPSMDIQISSNFERLLFDLHNNDGKAIATLMKTFHNSGSLKVDNEILRRARQVFDSDRVGEVSILKEMAAIYKETGMVADPHTAIGTMAAHTVMRDKKIPMVTLATAHPAKFPKAVEAAGIAPAPLPEHLENLLTREERYDIVENSAASVAGAIEQKLLS